jgi:hypothetical protein
MRYTIIHQEDQNTVRRAADAALSHYQERFPANHPEAVWTGPDQVEVSVQVKGVTLRGEVRLRPGVIELEMDVPLFLRVFRDRAVRLAESEVRKWLAVAHDGGR